MSKHKKRLIKAAATRVPTAQDIHRNARAALFAFEHIKAENDRLRDAYMQEHQNRFNVSPATIRLIEQGVIKVAPGPEVVMIALAVELYLKARLLADTGRQHKGHEIVKLFSKLTQARQQELIDQSAALNAMINKSDFAVNLGHVNDAFVVWRYSYEHDSLMFPISFAHALATALRSTFEDLT